MLLYARSGQEKYLDYFFFFPSVEAAAAEKEIPVEDFPFVLELDFPDKAIADMITYLHYGASYKDGYKKAKLVRAIDLRKQ